RTVTAPARSTVPSTCQPWARESTPFSIGFNLFIVFYPFNKSFQRVVTDKWSSDHYVRETGVSSARHVRGNLRRVFAVLRCLANAESHVNVGATQDTPRNQIA